MSLLAYWPTISEVDACIRTEAETADEAILLAVHEPARLSRRNVHTNQEEMATEEQLLEAFTAKELGGGSLLIPITGASGVGKSHMIRWLGAQLRRHPRAAKMHIITIPKSASLRGVVERILEPLTGPEYQELRKAIDTSVGSVSDSDAALRLATEIKIVLQQEAKKFNEQLRTLSPTDPQRPLLTQRLHHATHLPSLLMDSALAEHFQKAVLPRIVRRTLHGLERGEVEGAEVSGQFSVDDLSGLEDQGIENAARGVSQYYATVLNALQGKHREAAVTLLNQALDPAVRGVFQLSRTAGQLTMEDIVDRVRVKLLGEGRELVLLVEDFAALAGIQESLLNLSIVEATHGGKATRAILRTALAVTDGYLVGRDTILTRAKYQWVVRSDFGNDEDLAKYCVNVCGRYLNAALWGANTLIAQYEQSRGRGKGITDWVLPFTADGVEADVEDVANVFGRTEHGHRLFPLNEKAIWELAKRALPRGRDKREYNSRALIDGVLREPLLQRAAFEAGRFPYARYKNAQLEPRLQLAIDDALGDSEESARASTVMYFWGGDPKTIEEARELPIAVFKAFSVTPPFENNGRSLPPKVLAPSAPITPPEPSQPPDRVDSDGLEELKSKWRDWAGGKPMLQRDAANLRREWSEAICARIDEMELRTRELLDDPRQIASAIFIPGAMAGNPRVDDPNRPIIRLAEGEERDPTGRIQTALIAARRRTERGNWRYDGAEEDFASYVWLLEKLAKQATTLLMVQVDRRLSYLVPRLQMQSAVLGVQTRADQSSTELLALEAPKTGGITDWVGDPDQALAAYHAVVMQAIATRVAFQTYVFRLAGCYQGAGAKLYAFDWVRLQSKNASDAIGTPDLIAEWPDLREHLAQLSNDRLRTASQRAYSWLDSARKEITSLVGDSSLRELAETLERLVAIARDSAIGVNIGLDKSLIEKLKQISANGEARLLGLLNSGEKADPALATDMAMRGLSQVPFLTVASLRTILLNVSQLLTLAESTIAAQQDILEGTDPQPLVEKMYTLFSEGAATVGEATP